MKFLLFFLFLISSCKFQPIYLTGRLNSNDSLNSIEIASPEHFNLVHLNHHLSKLLPRTQDSKYILQINVSNGQTSYVNSQSDNFFYSAILNVSYELRKVSNNELVTKNNFVITSSYHVQSSPYSTYSNQEYTSELLAKKAAEEIRTKLIIFFQSYKE